MLQEWVQKVTRGTGAGRRVELRNLFATRRCGRAAAGAGGPGLMLGAHYDTSPCADGDRDPAARTQPVPGASDGASGVAVLLEMARALSVRPPAHDVVFAFWDGEDLGEYCYGSRAFAGERRRRELRALRARQGVVVDMVGGRGLRCTTELNSIDAAPALWAEVHSAADALGLGRHFRGPRARILDDHLFMTRAGIPSVLLIDFGYPYRHTASDTLAQCEPASLGAVGSVLLRLARGGHA